MQIKKQSLKTHNIQFNQNIDQCIYRLKRLNQQTVVTAEDFNQLLSLWKTPSLNTM